MTCTKRSIEPREKRALKRFIKYNNVANQPTMPENAPNENGSASEASKLTMSSEYTVVTAAVQVAISVGLRAVIVKPRNKLRLLPRFFSGTLAPSGLGRLRYR